MIQTLKIEINTKQMETIKKITKMQDTTEAKMKRFFKSQFKKHEKKAAKTNRMIAQLLKVAGCEDEDNDHQDDSDYDMEDATTDY
jgi:hypothetical protein